MKSIAIVVLMKHWYLVPEQVAGQLVLPGGASVILPHPDEGVSEFEVQLSPGCAIYPGAAEPVSFTGKTDDDEDESNTEKQVRLIPNWRLDLSNRTRTARAD